MGVSERFIPRSRDTATTNSITWVEIAQDYPEDLSGEEGDAQWLTSVGALHDAVKLKS